jgi:hypothetical protein
VVIVIALGAVLTVAPDIGLVDTKVLAAAGTTVKTAIPNTATPRAIDESFTDPLPF